MNNNINRIVKKLESGFLGFWIKQYKVSFLFVFLMIIIGIFSFISIDKKSSPDLNLGIINITKPYIGVNPEDIDSLITEKIEREIKDIEGISKITSTSSLGFASINVELENGVNVQDTMTEIKDEIDTIDFPNDAEKTTVKDISTADNRLFSIILHGDEKIYNKDYLLDKSLILKNNLEGKSGINKVLVNGGNDYEIRILLDKNKIDELGLNLLNISSIIKEHNKNTPIGNYSIDDLDYDFRFEGEIRDIKNFLNIPIKYNGESIIHLKDIASIKRHFKNDSVMKSGSFNKSGFNAIIIEFEKSNFDDLTSSSEKAKQKIKSELSSKLYEGLDYEIYLDAADEMAQSYSDLFSNMFTTFVLVFLTLLAFIGLKEGIIGILIVPLSYLITFTVLYYTGFSLNFLTNFSLILSLGVAIDTIIVVIEGANKKLKLGYSSRNAILVAIREYATPIISGTMTTLAAFIPMLTLPGIMGKYLSYIPITVFITLLSSLFLSLTVTSAIFMKLTKDIKFFRRDLKEEETLGKDEKILLEHDRIGKIEGKGQYKTIREKIFDKITLVYSFLLNKIIIKRINRIIIIIVPIIFLIFTFNFGIGFTLFPVSDNVQINIDISAKDGRNTNSMVGYISEVEKITSSIKEIKTYNIEANGNKINGKIELYKKSYRDENGLRNSFEIENEINSKLGYFRENGFKVETGVEAGGPPGGKAVGIRLIANSRNDLSSLIKISNDFENFLKNTPGTKNVSISSDKTPGQFIFKLDYDKISQLGLTPGQISSTIFFNTNGINSGTVKGLNDDYDIKLKIKEFENNLTPHDIENIIINTNVGAIKLGEVAKFNFDTAISKIDRTNTKINITVEADLLDSIVSSTIQPKLLDFAKNYDFPDGTSFESSGEAAENSDLIISTLSAFVIALFLIFTILVLQFNSYAQPFIILYSVVLALLGVNVGLVILQIPYSMAFAIGFIALTGIVINNAIIFIDKININLKEGIEGTEAILEAGKSRFVPMIVTTITTVFGMLPIAFQDEFWAGLGFTIVFGLVTGTIMTLFVIPSLYFELFLRKKIIESKN